jgi:hypothetical protein
LFYSSQRAFPMRRGLRVENSLSYEPLTSEANASKAAT